VIVMTEMPGISPQVARFARWVRDAGFTVHLPSLFGADGAVPTAEEGEAVFRRACVSAEFRALGGGASSPVTRWLMALARAAHEACGGPGVGAIGMCFTGNFALTMMLEPAVLGAGAPIAAGHDRLPQGSFWTVSGADRPLRPPFRKPAAAMIQGSRHRGPGSRHPVFHLPLGDIDALERVHL
jgi:dienelactone hydrolase